MDHLESMTKIPLERLRTFRVARRLPAMVSMPFSPPPRAAEVYTPPDENPYSVVGPIPFEVFNALVQQGRSLERLDLTWWEIDEERLGVLLKALSNLEETSLRLSCSIEKLVSRTADLTTRRLGHSLTGLLPRSRRSISPPVQVWHGSRYVSRPKPNITGARIVRQQRFARVPSLGRCASPYPEKRMHRQIISFGICPSN